MARWPRQHLETDADITSNKQKIFCAKKTVTTHINEQLWS